MFLVSEGESPVFIGLDEAGGGLDFRVNAVEGEFETFGLSDDGVVVQLDAVEETRVYFLVVLETGKSVREGKVAEVETVVEGLGVGRTVSVELQLKLSTSGLQSLQFRFLLHPTSLQLVPLVVSSVTHRQGQSRYRKATITLRYSSLSFTDNAF